MARVLGISLTKLSFAIADMGWSRTCICTYELDTLWRWHCIFVDLKEGYLSPFGCSALDSLLAVSGGRLSMRVSSWVA